jgi:hypothetical protein
MTMIRRSPKAALLILAGLVLVAGCATTRLVDTWKDPAFTGPAFKKMLVVGVTNSDSNRRVFEDGFARALQAAGTAGAPSYPSIPQKGAITNVQLDEAVKATGADSVLVTRVLRVKRDVNVTPGYVSPGFYGRGWGGYYGGAWAAMPPDVNVYDVLTIESTLFNARTDKPVWSGTNEVTDPRSVQAATEEIAKNLVTKMKADGVI